MPKRPQVFKSIDDEDETTGILMGRNSRFGRNSNFSRNVKWMNENHKDAVGVLRD